MNDKNAFTFIDLFAGIGGMRKGFEDIGGKCVFTSERDIYAQATYRTNYSCDGHAIGGDITAIPSEDIPSHDILLAGFPCQPFSLAGMASRRLHGKAGGFYCPKQGSLFFEIVRILDSHRPKAFLLENVKNLVTHDQGRTWRIILQTLSGDLGYHVRFRVLNARFWVPQNRARVFIVGFREETGFDFGALTLPDLSHAPVLKDILHPQDGTEEAEPPYTEGKKACVSKRYTLTDALCFFKSTGKDILPKEIVLASVFALLKVSLLHCLLITPKAVLKFSSSNPDAIPAVSRRGNAPALWDLTDLKKASFRSPFPIRKPGVSLATLWWFRWWNPSQNTWRRGFMCRLQTLVLICSKHLKNKKYPCCSKNIPIPTRRSPHES